MTSIKIQREVAKFSESERKQFIESVKRHESAGYNTDQAIKAVWKVRETLKNNA